MQEDLRGPAQGAAESVKSTAANAAQAVKDDATSATQDVRDRAAQAETTFSPDTALVVGFPTEGGPVVEWRRAAGAVLMAPAVLMSQSVATGLGVGGHFTGFGEVSGYVGEFDVEALRRAT